MANVEYMIKGKGYSSLYELSNHITTNQVPQRLDRGNDLIDTQLTNET